MKRPIHFFLLLAFVLFQGMATAQQRVDFVHGLNDDDAWLNTAPFLFNNFLINNNVLDYNDNVNSIDNINIDINQANVGFNNFRTDDIIIAHSMGGLLSRRAIDDGHNAAALITMGTPHLGGPLINNAMNNAGTVIGWWVNDLAQGWIREFGSAQAAAITNAVLNLLGAPALQAVLNGGNAGFNDPIAQDMVPGSAFLNNLNGAFANSIAPETFLLFGAEDWYSPWRLAESGLNTNGDDAGVEYGIAATIDVLLQIIYLQQFFYNTQTAFNYFNWGGIFGFIAGAYYIYVAQGYLQGFLSLNSWQQLDYNFLLDGSFGPGGNWTSDAFFPSVSQAPFMLPAGGNNLTFQALPGLNHAEEKNHPLVRGVLINILEFDLGVPRR
ncbi:MAG: hypothetical protein AAF990_08310 [Bacteroidota bacterium]